MSRNHLLGAAVLLALASGAQASSFVVTTDALVRGVNASTNATSDLSSSLRDNTMRRASSPARVISAVPSWKALLPTSARSLRRCRPATRNWLRPFWPSDALQRVPPADEECSRLLQPAHRGWFSDPRWASLAGPIARHLKPDALFATDSRHLGVVGCGLRRESAVLGDHLVCDQQGHDGPFRSEVDPVCP
jgi:hypothetical protein